MVFLASLAWTSAEALSPEGLLTRTTTVKLGDSAPPLTGTDLDGRTFSLQSWRGKPVLVNFGSMFCNTCQEVIGELNRLQEAYRTTDLALVVISTDTGTSPETLRAYFRQRGVRYPVVPDRDGSLLERYGVAMIPTQFLVDRRGRISRIHLGLKPDIEKTLGLPALFGAH